MTVLFAVMVVPVVGLVGLAIDYTIWNEADTQMSLAATTAVLDAVKIGAAALLAGDDTQTAQTEGKTAGSQWFVADIGNVFAASNVTPNVSVVIKGGKVSGTINFSANIKSVFGGLLFGVSTYHAYGTAAAAISTTPYLNVEILVDNSSSMDIGATEADTQTLMSLSACDPSNAEYQIGGLYTNASNDDYSNYQYTGNGILYNGPLSKPFKATVGAVSQTFTPIQQVYGQPPLCALPNAQKKTVNNVTYQPYAGPPCAFACHWDSGSNGSNTPVGQFSDLYGMARNTLGTSSAVTLRIDAVKQATITTILTMQADNLSINNLNVGVFSFNTMLTQNYPSSGEADHVWSAAIAAVGAPPTSPYGPDTGIIPVVGSRGGNNNNTNFVEVMNTLSSSYLTNSGDGSSADKPRKVLFIITDGFEDDSNNGARQAFPPSACAAIKNMGYTVYVIYTPYNPLELVNMFSSVSPEPWQSIVTDDATDQNSLVYNLQQCASAPSDYISASSTADLTKALNGFLISALNAPATLTQ